MVWKPRVVVASVLAREGRYLMVEEEIAGQMTLNQPAGHLEYGESLLDAVRRETLEETGYRFEPESLLGVILGQNEDPERVYLRFAFCGQISGQVEGYPLDDDIIATHWLSPDEIRQHPRLLPRNELVLHSIELYESGIRLPLESLHYMPMVFNR